MSREELIKEFVEAAKRVMYSFYPEEDVDVIINDRDSFTVIARKGDFEITNSSRDIHKITDYYMIFLFTIRESTEFKLDLRLEIRGNRGTVTEAEALVGYFHSHIPGSGGSYCLGSGILVEAYGEILGYNTAEEFEQKFERFIAGYDVALEWESIEGVPHARMSGIRTGRNNGSSRQVVNNYLTYGLTSEFKKMTNVFEDFWSLPLPFKLKADDTTEFLEIDERAFSEYIVNLSILFRERLTGRMRRKVLFEKINQTYYTVADPSARSSSHNFNFRSFTFKGESISPKVIYEVNEKDKNKEEPQLWVHEGILRNFLKEILSYTTSYCYKATLKSSDKVIQQTSTIHT